MDTTRALVPLLACLLVAANCRAADETPAPAVAANADAGATASDAGEALVASLAARPARWSASADLAEDGYRLSLSRGALDLGLHFESRLESPHPLDARADSAAPPGAMLPALSIGLRSVTAGPPPASLVARALGSASSVSYVSKVGIEWKPAQSQVFFHQGLGFRLGGDDKLIMRMRKGSLGLYVQRNF